MGSSRPSAEQKRLAALCEQAITELQSERRTARSASERRQIGTQIAVLNDMLAWAKAESAEQEARAKGA